MSSFGFRQVSQASTNLAQIKLSSANLTGGVIINTNAAIRYVKLYDATDSPVVGTTIPKLTLQIPASGQLALPQMALNFGHTAWMATTVNAVDSDTTAVGAGDLITQLFFE